MSLVLRKNKMKSILMAFHTLARTKPRPLGHGVLEEWLERHVTLLPLGTSLADAYDLAEKHLSLLI